MTLRRLGLLLAVALAAVGMVGCGLHNPDLSRIAQPTTAKSSPAGTSPPARMLRYAGDSERVRSRGAVPARGVTSSLSRTVVGFALAYGNTASPTAARMRELTADATRRLAVRLRRSIAAASSRPIRSSPAGTSITSTVQELTINPEGGARRQALVALSERLTPRGQGPQPSVIVLYRAQVVHAAGRWRVNSFNTVS